MKDVNHKISRQIIHFAVSNGVGVVRMEVLTGIRMAKSKNEAGRNLHHWSFYQLQNFIKYKAEMKCGHCHKNNVVIKIMLMLMQVLILQKPFLVFQKSKVKPKISLNKLVLWS